MELGTSDATLVRAEDVKIPLHRHSKISYLVAVGAMAIAVCFMVATAMLVDEMARSNKMHQMLEKELDESKEKVQRLSEEDNVCMTPECISSAAQLLESIDESADPCDDFYQFACGGWKKNNPIPKNHQSVSQFSILDARLQQYITNLIKVNSTITDSKALNKTRAFYSACMDLKTIDNVGLAPIISLIESFGKWPLITSNWSETDFDWRKASAALTSTFNVGFLFEIANFVDANDTNKQAIYLDQPELGVPIEIFKGSFVEQLRPAYEIFIYRVAKEFRLATSFETPIDKPDTNSSITDDGVIVIDMFSYFFETDEEMLKDISDLVDFQAKLADILTMGDLRNWNMTRMYNPMALEELQKWLKQVNSTAKHSQINWYQYLNDVYADSEVFISRRERVVVMEPNYFHRLVKLLDETSPRVIANYFYWKLLLHVISHAPSSLLDASHDFWAFVHGPNEDRESWCLSQVEELMGQVIGAKYVQDAFGAKEKDDVEKMVEKLMDAFVKLVEESTWMDEATKRNAVLKASSMNVLVGHPDWMRNNTELDQKYEEINPSQNSHFANYVQAKKLVTKNELSELRQVVNRKDSWYSLPNIVNAFYMPWLNVANIPAGILESPFYTHGRLAASNFAGIGFIIGHEITHGFDSNGHKRDKDGREISWWTSSTLQKYKRRIDCIVGQYNNYSLPELAGTDSHHLNGTKTLGENIADNGAIRESFRAYRNHVSVNGREPKLPGLERFTSEQIFFLSFAQTWCNQATPQSLRRRIKNGVHSPNQFRVIGPLSNSEDFIEHFKCTVGTRMNRLNKCIVW